MDNNRRTCDDGRQVRVLALRLSKTPERKGAMTAEEAIRVMQSIIAKHKSGEIEIVEYSMTDYDEGEHDFNVVIKSSEGGEDEELPTVQDILQLLSQGENTR